MYYDPNYDPLSVKRYCYAFALDRSAIEHISHTVYTTRKPDVASFIDDITRIRKQIAEDNEIEIKRPEYVCHMLDIILADAEQDPVSAADNTIRVAHALYSSTPDEDVDNLLRRMMR